MQQIYTFAWEKYKQIKYIYFPKMVFKKNKSKCQVQKHNIQLKEYCESLVKIIVFKVVSSERNEDCNKFMPIAKMIFKDKKGY